MEYSAASGVNAGELEEFSLLLRPPAPSRIEPSLRVDRCLQTFVESISQIRRGDSQYKISDLLSVEMPAEFAEV